MRCGADFAWRDREHWAVTAYKKAYRTITTVAHVHREARDVDVQLL